MVTIPHTDSESVILSIQHDFSRCLTMVTYLHDIDGSPALTSETIRLNPWVELSDEMAALRFWSRYGRWESSAASLSQVLAMTFDEKRREG